jgi:DNA-3-methyladenine glycosylase
MTPLKRDFFAQPTLTVAKELLGKYLVREVNGQRLSGIIVETEAYIGPNDSASHASKGRTPRSAVMFGPPGFTYIYFIYGMYHMLNFITEQEDFPAAVLIRAVEPVEGVRMMQANRQRPNALPLKMVNLTNGPGKLCQALAIDRNLNKRDATTGQNLWVESQNNMSNLEVATGPRVGINFANPKDRDAAWRFWLKGNRFISKG